MGNQPIQNPDLVSPITSQSNPTSKPKINLSKWLIAGVIVLVLLIVAGAGIYFLGKNNAKKVVTQTPTQTTTLTTNPTANWKTYSNSNYGFSFQYPSYLTTVNDKFPKEIPSVGTVSDELRISSADYKNDLQVYINSHFGGMCGGTLIYSAKRSGSNLSFTKTKGDNSNLPAGASCSSFYEAKIDLGDGNYLDTNFSYDSKNTNAQADFEKMLSTFQFTNSTSSSTDETANWKTYTGNYFTIKYPDGWTVNDQSYSSGGQLYIGFSINGPLRSDVQGANGKNAYYLQAIKYDTGSEALAPNTAFGPTGEEFVFQKGPTDQSVNQVPTTADYTASSSEHSIAAQILSTFKLTK